MGKGEMGASSEVIGEKIVIASGGGGGDCWGVKEREDRRALLAKNMVERWRIVVEERSKGCDAPVTSFKFLPLNIIVT